MKKRFFATVLTLALSAVMLMGCGSSPAEAETDPANISAEFAEPAESDGSAIPDDSTGETTSNTYVVNEQGEAITQFPNDNGMDDDFGRPPEEDLVSWDVEAGEEDVTEEVPVTGEVDGIIVLQADWSDLYCPTYTVSAINPESGDYHEVSNFWFDSVFERTNPEYTIVPALQFARYANLRDQFSSDYTKTAATKTFASNGEVHAGWVTTDGDFFDVTEALDEQSHGDFDDVVNYQAVGFQNDVFIYVHSEGFEENQYYGVSVDNVAPGASWELSTADPMICEDYTTWSYIRGYKPTDWIDDDRLIIEANNQSYIATTSSQTKSEYIPASDSRYSWSAVVSPDNTKIAFLSEPRHDTTGEVGIYTMPLDSSEPARLETTFSPTFSMSAGSTVKYFGVKEKCCYILEWR